MSREYTEAKRAYNHAYYIAHKEQGKARRKIYEAGRREQRRAHDKEYRLLNRDKIIAYQNAHRLQHNANNKAYRDAHRDEIHRKSRISWLKTNYGITPEIYEALLLEQGDGCAVCGSSKWRGKNNRPIIDHDHRTGRIRGIVCHGCNIALGYVHDNPQLAIALAIYLQDFSKKHLDHATDPVGKEPPRAVNAGR